MRYSWPKDLQGVQSLNVSGLGKNARDKLKLCPSNFFIQKFGELHGKFFFVGLLNLLRRISVGNMKYDIKCSRYRAGVAQRVGRGIALLFHDRGTRRGWVVSSTPGRTLPPGNTRHSFYRRLGGTQGRSGRAENLVPTGILSRTFQPVVSRYADWATRPTCYNIIFN